MANSANYLNPMPPSASYLLIILCTSSIEEFAVRTFQVQKFNIDFVPHYGMSKMVVF